MMRHQRPAYKFLAGALSPRSASASEDISKFIYSDAFNFECQLIGRRAGSGSLLAITRATRADALTLVVTLVITPAAISYARNLVHAQPFVSAEPAARVAG